MCCYQVLIFVVLLFLVVFIGHQIFNFGIKKRGAGVVVYLKNYLRGNCVTYDDMIFHCLHLSFITYLWGHLNIEIKLGVYYARLSWLSKWRGLFKIEAF